MKNLINFKSESGKEYSVNLQTLTIGEKEVMFITITTLDTDSMEDYTVILNGLPTLKNIQKACGRDVEAAELIIKTLKEKAVEEACEYWDFNLGSDDEWGNCLDAVLYAYTAAERERKRKLKDEAESRRI